MSTGSEQQPAPAGAPGLKRERPSGLRTIGETFLLIVLAGTINKLHRKGILFPGLSDGAFIAVLLGALLVLAGIMHLLGRRSARSGKGES
jgi:hypothetical protein